MNFRSLCTLLGSINRSIDFESPWINVQVTSGVRLQDVACARIPELSFHVRCKDHTAPKATLQPDESISESPIIYFMLKKPEAKKRSGISRTTCRIFYKRQQPNKLTPYPPIDYMRKCHWKQSRHCCWPIYWRFASFHSLGAAGPISRIRSERLFWRLHLGPSSLPCTHKSRQYPGTKSIKNEIPNS